MIVLLGNEKGGCGKSTIATNLAAWLASRADVVLLDADRQATSATWASDREGANAPTVHCVQKYDNIKSTVDDLASRYEHVVIDAGGRDSKELRTALLAANVVVVPFRPSQPDIDTAPAMAEIIAQAKDFNENLQVVAVLTQCPTNPAIKEIQEAEEALSEYIEVLPVRVYDRKVYRDAISQGLGATEMNNPKAKDEINELAQVIFNG